MAILPDEENQNVDSKAIAPAEPIDSAAVEMSFLDHLEELRWVIAKCFGVFLLSCLLVGVFVFQFADLLRWPYEFALRGQEGVDDTLYIRGFMGVFSVMLQLFFLGGLSISLPFMLLFLGKFIAPGLTLKERRMLLPGSLAAFVLFLAGASFSFWILLPAGLRASVMFSQMFGFELLIDASSYYGLLMWATMGVGAAFEFPLVLLLLIHMGVATTVMLKNYRRHAIIAFLVLSAVVTPTPDPITFLFLAIPLYVLYELSIFVGGKVERRREAEHAMTPEDDTL
jgi:sec-independent protein translocase protein TatC|tara:strand:- start:4346 stop:5194 length:849 start_codon:yes stop_codon:yes gene_type:complete